MSLTTISNSAGDDTGIAGPSTQTATLCATCNSEAAKYTCPRCQVRTCSLSCSRSHKETTGCSGIRDKVAYVPMNQYGYATMVNDYVLLEEVGRKVGEWGREIVKGGLLANGSMNSSSISGRGGRGGRGGMRSYGRTHDKRRYLSLQLAFRDVYMDVLPQGMERAKRNKSFWDSKNRTAFITIEFIITPPREHATQEKRRISIQSNKNDWTRPIRDLVKSTLRKTMKDEKLLDWLGLDDEANDISTLTSVLCIMRRPKAEDDPSDPTFGKDAYYKLDYDMKLCTALRNKHFVEYPTIELVDEPEFSGLLVEEDGYKIDPGERRPKRRKLDAETAKKTITGLVGGYGSDEEDEQPNQLSILEEYAKNSGDEDGDPSAPSSDEDDIGDDGEAVVIVETSTVTEDDKSDIDADGEAELQDVLGTTEARQDIVDLPSEDERGLEWMDEEIAADEARLADLSNVLRSRQK